MNTQVGFERCLTFINCQLQPGAVAARARGANGRLAITLSRQTGAGGLRVASRLAEYLESRAQTGGCPWTVFDKNLTEKVLEDHHLPKKLAQFLPEDQRSMIDEMMEELLGLHPPSWTLVHQMTETILRLAEVGNVVLVGRGATVITARMPNVFHARLVGSLERRLERVQERYHLERTAALDFLGKEERGRQRYVRKYFGVELDDPQLYHLVINTDRITCEDAAGLIAEAALRVIAPDG